MSAVDAVVVTVAGLPITQGSMRAVSTARGARLVHAKSPQLSAWRRAVALSVVSAAVRAGWHLPLDEPVSVCVEFRLPRPARPRFEAVPATRPDLDKLQRAVGDALGEEVPRVLSEDSRIVEWVARKRYAHRSSESGVVIRIRRGAPAWACEEQVLEDREVA